MLKRKTKKMLKVEAIRDIKNEVKNVLLQKMLQELDFVMNEFEIPAQWLESEKKEMAKTIIEQFVKNKKSDPKNLKKKTYERI